MMLYFLFCLFFQQGQRLILNSRSQMTKNTTTWSILFTSNFTLIISNLTTLSYICYVIMSFKVLFLKRQMHSSLQSHLHTTKIDDRILKGMFKNSVKTFNNPDFLLLPILVFFNYRSLS